MKKFVLILIAALFLSVSFSEEILGKNLESKIKPYTIESKTNQSGSNF
jgi:hypothetical protein